MNDRIALITRAVELQGADDFGRRCLKCGEVCQ
jgi:hypothetical protein